jgi:predicted RNA-binding protein (virulence factor B family)
MTDYLRPGAIQELMVTSISEEGVFVGNDHEEIPLNKIDTKGVVLGQTLKIFSYFNDRKELEATTRIPEIQVGEMGMFTILNSNDLGAFINIGVGRDVLIPKREQRQELLTNRKALIMLCYDSANHRLFGTTKIFNHLKEVPDFKRGDEIEMTIFEKLEVGRKVIVNGKYQGIIFQQEIMSRVSEGDKVKGYVRKIEGKDVVVSMQKEGVDLIEDAAARLLEFLENNGGYIRLNDDSDPDEIKIRLRMSKKTFKKAAGLLYKQEKVDLMKFGVKLLTDGQKPTPRDIENWKDKPTDDVRKPYTAKKLPVPNRRIGDSFGNQESKGYKEVREGERGEERGRDFKNREEGGREGERGDYSRGEEKGREVKKWEDKGSEPGTNANGKVPYTSKKSRSSSSNTSRPSRPSDQNRGPRR